MPRTNLTKKQLRAPWDKTKNTALYTKLANHDTGLDALEIAGSALLTADAITANSAGRLAFQTGVFDETTATRIFAAQAIATTPIKNSAITAAKIADNVITGGKVAVSAPANTVPAIRIKYIVTVPDGATGNVDTTVDATGGITITEVQVLKNTAAGGASDTIQVFQGATTNAITNAMDINVAANVTVRNSTLVSTYAAIAGSGIIRVTRTKASAANVGCTVIIGGYHTA